jgi:dTDP-4-dehydrorhamnose 3,5-epimerase
VRAISTAISDVLVIKPQIFSDDRGGLLESFNRRKFGELLGRDVDFVQDNHSYSNNGILRNSPAEVFV